MINLGLLILSLCVLIRCTSGQHEREKRDGFDEIHEKLNKTIDCSSNYEELFLSEQLIYDYLTIQNVTYNRVPPYRNKMLYLQSIAMNRAFFWSYIIQSRFIRPANNNTYDPGMLYYFLSLAADVSVVPNVYGSAIYFPPNKAFTSSFKDFFNKTLSQFAPRAFREQSNYQFNQQNGSKPNIVSVKDHGAFDLDPTIHYLLSESIWLPDQEPDDDNQKAKYQVDITYANSTKQTFIFYGPPTSDETPLQWTRGFHDCGVTNEWLVATSALIVDIYPRHTEFRAIEKPLYTAAVVMEMDFEKIDINQCPSELHNDRSIKLAGTARCKESTECEPLPGYGFRRGGYQCRCAPGYQLPSDVHAPYLGETIEQDTTNQTNYVCLKRPPLMSSMPPKPHRVHPSVRAAYQARHQEYSDPKRGAAALHSKPVNIHEVIKFVEQVQPDNCHKYHSSDLVLSRDMAYGHEEQFNHQAKTAARLANFISAFLQVLDPEDFSGDIVADKPLTEDQMIGETVAILFGDNSIWSAGIYWDRNKFTNRSFFAPLAYKTELKTKNYKVEDLAGVTGSEDVYTNKPWFGAVKQRWSSDVDELEKFYLKLKMRSDIPGLELKKYQKYPTEYRAANLEQGYWTTPYYDCEGHLKQWVITYAVPFFGWDSVKVKLEFKGLVAVTVLLKSLDINQCTDGTDEANAFKGTHKCDTNTTKCVPKFGLGFNAGGYDCQCLEGYEYPYEIITNRLDGQLMEDEYQNIISDRATYFDMLKCRKLEPEKDKKTDSNTSENNKTIDHKDSQ